MRDAGLSSFGGLELSSRHQMMIGSSGDAENAETSVSSASHIWEKIPQIHTLKETTPS